MMSRLSKSVLLVLPLSICIQSRAIDPDDFWQSGFVPPPGVAGTVHATVVIGRDLYVGGDFLIFGSPEIRHLARWDGTNWFPLGAGINGPVYSLAAQKKALVVGGKFTEAGGLA